MQMLPNLDMPIIWILSLDRKRLGETSHKNYHTANSALYMYACDFVGGSERM